MLDKDFKLSAKGNVEKGYKETDVQIECLMNGIAKNVFKFESVSVEQKEKPVVETLFVPPH
jgi:hypothetical protein